MTRIEVFQETERLAAAAADLVLHAAREAVRERGRFVWGLSGGSTPAIIYRALAGKPYARRHAVGRNVRLLGRRAMGCREPP